MSYYTRAQNTRQRGFLCLPESPATDEDRGSPADVLKLCSGHDAACAKGTMLQTWRLLQLEQDGRIAIMNSIISRVLTCCTAAHERPYMAICG